MKSAMAKAVHTRKAQATKCRSDTLMMGSDVTLLTMRKLVRAEGTLTAHDSLHGHLSIGDRCKGNLAKCLGGGEAK